MTKLVNIEAFGIKYESYILIEDFKDLETYYEKFRKRQIYDANDDLRNSCHKTLLANFAFHTFKMKTGESDNIRSIRFLIDVIGSVYVDQLKLVLDGKKLAINMKGGYFPLPKDAIIQNTEIQYNKNFKSKFNND